MEIVEDQRITRLRDIAAQIRYKDWWFKFGRMEAGAYLQVCFLAPDSQTGNMVEQKGRKWYLSPFMVETEIVSTAWMAVQAAEIHEAREQFFYKDKLPYNSHISIDALMEASGKLDYRDRRSSGR